MRYYVVADVHGFYDEMIDALSEKGFFEDPGSKLIVCGDMMDRGKQAVDMQAFMTSAMESGRLIFVRGNHEDLMLDMLHDFDFQKELIQYGHSAHLSNGTFGTALQLAGVSGDDAIKNGKQFVRSVLASDFCRRLIPSSVNYFETDHYIFTHGYIPVKRSVSRFKDVPEFTYSPYWANAKDYEWEDARWLNGMKIASDGIRHPDKTIVCGHWHCSFGHSNIEGKCSEFGEDADFSPYYGDGVIGLDGCTAHSGIVNCIVIEDTIGGE